MSGEMVKARLKGPTKIGARWLKAGDEEVTAEEHTALAAAGLLEELEEANLPESEPEADQLGMVTVTRSQFLEAVELQAKALADAVTTAAIEEAVSQIIQERDEAKAKAAGLEEELAQLRAAALNPNPSPASAGEVVAADSNKTSPPDGATATATTNTPPSEKVAKTAPKKGAATATKG